MNWFEQLTPILTTKEMSDVRARIKSERETKKIWPLGPDVFKVFQICSYEHTRVVILGQDPYPNNHAHGIAFSSLQDRQLLPKSLANIFNEVWKELYEHEVYSDAFQTGDLTGWVEQGVLLMNTVLTVREDEPDSHADIGWDFFTGKVMEMLNNHPNNLVFMLWGSKAKRYRDLITQERHLILEAPHPSPMSANSGFFGCGHFIKTNEFLREQFFKEPEERLKEIMPFGQMAEITGKYLQSKGIETNFEDVKRAAEYYGIRFPKFLEQLAPDIATKYIINFRTVNHGK